MEDRCVFCGEIIPEGRQVCMECEMDYVGAALKNKENTVNHPKHYNTHKHECIDEMIALFGVEAVKGFCKCNVHKYRYRAEAKCGSEDLDKANWYMDKLMELEGAEK